MSEVSLVVYRIKCLDKRSLYVGLYTYLTFQVVSMISTAHTGEGSQWVRRRVKGQAGQWEQKVVQKPEVVHQYNIHMGGVDKSDQLIAPYNVLMKSMRWWKTLFFHMIDVAVVNSFILFQEWREQHPDVPALQRPPGTLSMTSSFDVHQTIVFHFIAFSDMNLHAR